MGNCNTISKRNRQQEQKAFYQFVHLRNEKIKKSAKTERQEISQNRETSQKFLEMLSRSENLPRTPPYRGRGMRRADHEGREPPDRATPSLPHKSATTSSHIRRTGDLLEIRSAAPSRGSVSSVRRWMK